MIFTDTEVERIVALFGVADTTEGGLAAQQLGIELRAKYNKEEMLQGLLEVQNLPAVGMRTTETTAQSWIKKNSKIH